MKRTKGKVYLVGAGPGDPGLLTVKGRDILSSAQVVIYDALVNPAILKHAKRAQKLFAGKKGRKSMTQDAINQLMAHHAQKGKIVVRLKGGDPFVFGRGGEEAEHLSLLGIPFEVVPGVSSVTAVPAYAGIPVTDRRFTSVLTVVTGHSKDDASDQGPSVDWKKIPRGTLVILMGVENFSTIVKNLLKEGWPPTTPVALIRNGTLSNQETIVGNISTIIPRLKKLKKPFLPPAVIVVGEVVGMRDRLFCD